MAYNETVEMSKDSKTTTYSGRKRLNENELQPPAKKGTNSLANKRPLELIPQSVNRKVASTRNVLSKEKNPRKFKYH